MKILVINAGSSSLKYQFIDMENNNVIAKGLCERIGIDGKISHKTYRGESFTDEIPMPTHTEAFKALIDLLVSSDIKVVESMDEITAVGHRVVHGAEDFSKSVLITENVVQAIEDNSDLAPLHNPAHILAIRACQRVFGYGKPQVAVFDTAFHQTMPKKAFVYALPQKYYTEYRIRKYGFHGTSHRFVSARLAQAMNKDIKDMKIITCHLGNGSSITAINKGESVDTTMGFTPLDGLIMGTRSGSIDPAAALFIMEKENLTVAEMSNLLNKQSGLLGVSGISSDSRDIESAADNGNVDAALAIDMLTYQVKKYIGAFAAAMGGVDAIAFTGGIGENSASTREAVCENLEFLGLEIDKEVNKTCRGVEKDFSTPNSKVKAWVIPTNEELLIAQDTAEIVESL